MMKHYEVVAAVIEHDGKILCMQRNKGKFDYVSYKFEFPGGKVEAGEERHTALERELREGRLVHVPLDTPTTLYSELGLYVRAGRTLPSALDAFNRIAADAIETREDDESMVLRGWSACAQDSERVSGQAPLSTSANTL